MVLCVRLRPCGLFQMQVGLVVDVLLVLLTDLMGVACDVTKETQSHSKVSDPLALKIFLVPILQRSLSLKCGSVLLMCPLGLGSAF